MISLALNPGVCGAHARYDISYILEHCMLPAHLFDPQGAVVISIKCNHIVTSFEKQQASGMCTECIKMMIYSTYRELPSAFTLNCGRGSKLWKKTLTHHILHIVISETTFFCL